MTRGEGSIFQNRVVGCSLVKKFFLLFLFFSRHTESFLLFLFWESALRHHGSAAAVGAGTVRPTLLAAVSAPLGILEALLLVELLGTHGEGEVLAAVPTVDEGALGLRRGDGRGLLLLTVAAALRSLPAVLLGVNLLTHGVDELTVAVAALESDGLKAISLTLCAAVVAAHRGKPAVLSEAALSTHGELELSLAVHALKGEVVGLREHALEVVGLSLSSRRGLRSLGTVTLGIHRIVLGLHLGHLAHESVDALLGGGHGSSILLDVVATGDGGLDVVAEASLELIDLDLTHGDELSVDERHVESVVLLEESKAGRRGLLGR
jgi:hypothetical protein